MSIDFLSVGDYPNGYQLTNDELEALNAVVQMDPSCNYDVREVNVGKPGYHLEVTATYQDEEVPPGPVYTIADGIITKVLPAAAPTTTGDVIRQAADLLSDGGENAEYDRALVELVGNLLGVDLSDDEPRAAILRMMQAVRP